MKIEYNNLYTHFIFITSNRLPTVEEKNRVRIEKYITGVVHNNESKLYLYMLTLSMFILLFRVRGNYLRKSWQQ